MDDKLILITNPGSSSRRYALYQGEKLLCKIHFEHDGDNLIYTLRRSDTTETKRVKCDFKNLSSTVANLGEILEKENYIGTVKKLDLILARVVAPGEYFSENHLVDEKCLRELENAKNKAPLHVPIVANEIAHFMTAFKDAPIMIISDSKFHNSRPELNKIYAIDPVMANQYGIKRWGFHGLSNASVVRYLKSQDILPEKLVVCHIGSGVSATAVFDGKSHDTTMGYTPLEGTMMATRSGSLDVAAALAIKRARSITTDQGLEDYLNKKCGLLGVSGVSDDMRDIIRLRDEGDSRAVLAHALFINRLQLSIGQMAASLGGTDALVFTATMGERSDEIRRTVTQKLAYLGFALDEQKNISVNLSGKEHIYDNLLESNDETTETINPDGSVCRHVNIAAEGSKPIYVVKTDEVNEMILQAEELLKNSSPQNS